MIEIICKGRVIKRYRSRTWFKRWIKARIKRNKGIEIGDTAAEIIGVLTFSDSVSYGEQEPIFNEAIDFRWITNSEVAK